MRVLGEPFEEDLKSGFTSPIKFGFASVWNRVTISSAVVPFFASKDMASSWESINFSKSLKVSFDKTSFNSILTLLGFC